MRHRHNEERAPNGGGVHEIRVIAHSCLAREPTKDGPAVALLTYFIPLKRTILMTMAMAIVMMGVPSPFIGDTVFAQSLLNKANGLVSGSSAAEKQRRRAADAQNIIDAAKRDVEGMRAGEQGKNIGALGPA